MNSLSMCYHKSLVQKYDALMARYSASFHSIQEELNQVKERFTVLALKDDFLKSRTLENPEEIGAQLIKYSEKDSLPAAYTKQELSEMKWCLKTLTGFEADRH